MSRIYSPCLLLSLSPSCFLTPVSHPFSSLSTETLTAVAPVTGQYKGMEHWLLAGRYILTGRVHGFETLADTVRNADNCPYARRWIQDEGKSYKRFANCKHGNKFWDQCVSDDDSCGINEPDSKQNRTCTCASILVCAF